MTEPDSSDDALHEEIELLSTARAEARRTIDSQVQTLDDIDSKAARILRVNLVLLSLLLTGLSLAVDTGTTQTSPVQFPTLVNAYTTAGFVSLLLSTGLAGITYTASNLRAGMSAPDLRNVVDNEYTDRENVEGLIMSYANWIEHNYVVNAKNAPLLTLTILLLIYAITLLAFGLKQAVTGHVEWWLAVGTGVLLLGVTHFTGFYDQVKRYYRFRRT